MTYTPIALFTYSRAAHTKAAIESLQKNVEASDTDLFVFSDGAKRPEKAEAVRKNREYIHTVKGFKTITIIEREKNWGLANSLIAGITDIINKYGRVIVVEDDLIVSPFFLRYMNDALDKYADDERVASVSAFLNPIEGNIPETFFLRYFACWGWATWKRAWDLFNPDANALLKQLRWKVNDFNIDGSSNFYGMLYCQKIGLVDSWAIRFYASLFLKGKLNLFPGRTMALQNGLDNTGTHSGIDTSYSTMRLGQTPIAVNDIPVEENKGMRHAFSLFYKSKTKTSLYAELYTKFKSFIRRLLGVDYL